MGAACRAWEVNIWGENNSMGGCMTWLHSKKWHFDVMAQHRGERLLTCGTPPVREDDTINAFPKHTDQ